MSHTSFFKPVIVEMVKLRFWVMSVAASYLQHAETFDRDAEGTAPVSLAQLQHAARTQAT